MHGFFNLGGGKALAADWYVVSGDTGNQIKYYQASTPYNVNNWSSANSSNKTADNLKTFLNGTDSNSPASGDTVYIKEGTYKLSAEIALTSKLLHLYGGFDGTETTSSDRNSDTGTTLDAQKQTYRVITISTDSTIDGFTITGGNINNDNGGGIYISNASPTIINCTITGNTASGHNSNGGGIHIESGNPTITNCAITGNTAGGSGGGSNGGGIYINSGGATITSCAINDNNGYGFAISSEGNPKIINCTITGNSNNGIYISGGYPTITNCTIVNNAIAITQGAEVYSGGSSPKLRNTLIWNNSTDKVSGLTHNYVHCAWPGATGANHIALTTWENPVSSDVKVKGVTHRVYLAENNSVLYMLVGKGVSNDTTPAPTVDQIGNARANPPSIGAAEYVPPVLSADISGDIEISTSYGTAKTLTFTPIVRLDNVALTSTNYTVSWDVSVSPTASAISIDQSGKLTVGSTTPAGSYDVTVKAQATYTAITTPVIKSNIAEKKVNITVESGDINLTLTSKDLPGGKVGTAYTEAQYFTAAATPSSADISWEVDGLPAGLSFNEGTISGTPTASGNFSVKVTVTATLTNYNPTSKDITASMTIEAADEQSGGSESGDDEQSGGGGSESSDITLTLTSQTLPNGKVGTAYTEAQYFTATATPSSADIAWKVEGLPAGLSFNKGTISGTPTASGDFSVKVTVTATLTNYTTTSKDITASLTIEAADEQSGGSEGGGGGSDDGETITVPSSGISGLTPTQKQKVKTLILNSVDDLSQITATDFPNLTSVKISSDVEVGNGGALDLSSLPATITTFSISGNSSIKSLNLKASKVANIDASGCSELKSVDVSGNTFIVTLDVSSTDIELLDASNCTNLTSVDCSYCLLSELNVVACNALKSINCSHNSLLALDIPSGLANLASVDCISQELGNWRSTVSFNFDDFSESPDIIPSEDNTVSASSVVRLSATKLSNVANLKAYNKSGDIIPIIASDDNGNITFASAPDIMTYDYNIGFKNTSMDVTVYAADNELNDTIGSSSSCGCNVIKNEGLGIMNVLILLLLLLAPLKIKKI